MGIYRDTIIAAAPVAYWPMSETSGSVADNAMSVATTLDGTWTDVLASTPGSIFGTFKWPKLVVGENETSTNLENGGGGASVFLPNSASFESQTFSVEFWFRWSGISGKRVIFSYDNAGTGATPTRGFQIFSPDPSFSRVNIVYYDSSGTSDGTLNPTTQIGIVDGHEYHCVVVRDPSSVKIYVDGVLITNLSTSITTIAWPTGGTARTWIGRQGTDTYDGLNTSPWALPLGHVAYYNRALSLTEIADHYVKGSTREDTRVNYTAQTWMNGSGGGTPVNATRLTKIETGIYDAFAGRRQEADYVIVSADAPNYMKRGPRTLVCTGTNDQDVVNQAITDAVVLGRGPFSTSNRVSILLSPGAFSFSPSSVNEGTGEDDIGIKRCVWTGGHQSILGMATNLSLRGCGNATQIFLDGGQTDPIYMFDLMLGQSTVGDFTIDGNVDNQTSGEHYGLVINGNRNTVQNIRGNNFSGGVAMETGWGNTWRGLHLDNSKYGLVLSGSAEATVVGVGGESYVNDSIGVWIRYGASFHTVSGANLEGFTVGVMISEDSYQNSVTGFDAYWADGHGVVLDSAHENRISGNARENYSGGCGIILRNGSVDNDIDMHIVGNEGHGILVDASSNNRIRGVVTANGQGNGATPTFDNVHVRSNSDRNSIEVFSRKSSHSYSTESRFGVAIADSTCDSNRVANSDLLDAGADANLFNQGTGTIESGNRIA